MGALPENLLVMITDPSTRKSFDLANILRTRRIGFILCGAESGIEAAALSLIYGRPLEPLRNGERFETDLLAILDRYADASVVYIPVEEDTTLAFYRFLRKHNDHANLHYNLPPEKVFALVRDKLLFSRFCEEEGLPVPRRYEYAELAQMRSLPGDIIIKPRIGSGSVGIRRLQRGEEMPQLQFEGEEASLIQERLPNGSEIEGAFFLMYRDQAVGYYGHRRLRTYPPDGGVTVYSRCAINPKLRAVGEKLLQKLRWSGIAMVEFLYDRKSDAYKIIEINPRLWGSLMLSEFCGSEIIENYCRTALGIDTVTPDIKSDRAIRWFFPWDLLLYIRSSGKIAHFWRFGRRSTCYINATYASWPRAIAFLGYNIFHPAKLKRLITKVRG